MKFACPHCGQRLAAEPLDAGRNVNCPACAAVLTVPDLTDDSLQSGPVAPPDFPMVTAYPADSSAVSSPAPPVRSTKAWSRRHTVAGAVAVGILLAGGGWLAHQRGGVGARFAGAFSGGSQPHSVRVFPANVNLTTKTDRQSLVVQAVDADGVTRDVTDKASYLVVDAKLARRDGATLYPVADGSTTLKVRYGGQEVTVPVTVERSAVESPISFRLDVMPVFAKAGCNSGGCHGASRGKDGFQLSLFGYDPDGDYTRLTREQIGRRINLALPAESLIVEKGLGTVQHGGGERFKLESEMCQTLIRWITAGVPNDTTNVARVTGVELLPAQAVLEGSNVTHRVNVRARYSDGTDRDVTQLATFFSNNEPSARVDADGIVTAGQRGEAYITARFDEFTVGAQFLVVPPGAPPSWPESVQPQNYIDELVFTKLRKLRQIPSDVCDDSTFLRRVHLDLSGTLPTVDEIRDFAGNLSTGKRAEVVDRLLERKEFADIWVMKFAELLQIRSRNDEFSLKAALLYYSWLQEQFRTNTPVDQIVQTLLTARGSNFKTPAASYFQVEKDTLKISENVAQVFMGMRIQCAQCHNHPFDRWTMNDYYSFAAFFPQVGRKPGEDPRETIIYDRPDGEMVHPVSKKSVAPQFLGAVTPPLKAGENRRATLAKWLASPENPQFARNLANIVWAHFLGRGIVEPVDDVRVSNPASNPELLEELGHRLTGYRYDFKKLVRDICTSRTYQLAATTKPENALDDRNFSHAQIRRIRAEVLYDVISDVTGTQNKFRGLPRGARTVEIPDGNEGNYFLTTFGRARRDTVCACEVRLEPNLSQALHLLNGDTVERKVAEGGVVRKLIAEKAGNEAILEELYLRTLARPPTTAERSKLLAYFGNAGDAKTREQLFSDILWSLLNAKEFIFNH